MNRIEFYTLKAQCAAKNYKIVPSKKSVITQKPSQTAAIATKNAARNNNAFLTYKGKYGKKTAKFQNDSHGAKIHFA